MDGISVLSPAVDGKLEVKVYLVDDFQRDALSRLIDDFGVD